ncbi:MAG TPA: DUF4340 domain-containing protein [Vicinamibacterales bacterium]|nr:DUF4340 domain-containing protein [Vicinamibacterales bacterium]
MRGLRSTIALVVVLVGLGGYIYFVTWKKPEADTGTKQEKVFAGVQSDKIDELTITSGKGEKTTLKKDGSAWQVTSPISAKADESEVSGITSNLSSVEVTRVIDDKPANLKEYGLETPRVEVDFKAAGDKEPRRLFLGDKSPTGSSVYAKRNAENRVFLIPAFQDTAFDKSSFDLRDKTLVKFDRDKVDGIELTADGKTTALTKDGSDWKLTKPLQTKADFGSVEGLIGRMQSAQMKSIVTAEPTPADLKKYGLDKPSETVTLDLGSARAVVELGGKAEDNTIYARDTARPIVMTVESSLADELKKGADDYRRKDVFEFRAFNATHIELTRNGQTVAFDKTKNTGKDAQTNPDIWKRVSPSAKDANKDTMDALLSRLSNMRATSFVASTAGTGLDKPALVVDVKFDDGKKEERVTFGQNGSDTYASRPGEPGGAKVDTADFTDVIKSLDELAK